MDGSLFSVPQYKKLVATITSVFVWQRSPQREIRQQRWWERRRNVTKIFLLSHCGSAVAQFRMYDIEGGGGGTKVVRGFDLASRTCIARSKEIADV